MLVFVLSLALAEDPLRPPLPPPAAVEGCVPQEAVVAYEAKLTALADQALERALGDEVRFVTRAGFLVDPGHEPDSMYEVDGKRFGFLGPWDASAAPTARLARIGNTLHRVLPEPTAREVALTVCGANPCIPGRGAMPNIRALAVELEEGEQLGAPLRPEHDSWWVLKSYQASRHCQPVP